MVKSENMGEYLSRTDAEGNRNDCTCMPPRKRMFIIPRHLDYWYEVYCNADNPAAPVFMECGCYDDEKNAERYYDRDEFYHFDIGNIAGARCIFDELDKSNSWEEGLKRSDFEAQLKRLESGEIDYFIGCLYFPDEPRFHGCVGQLSKGKTLLDYVNENGVPSYYAVLYVRETGPLLPDVLCAHMEKLSPVLFGEQFEFRIPEAIIPDRKQMGGIDV